MPAPERAPVPITLARAGGPSFDAEIARVLVEGPSSVLEEARRTSPSPLLPETLVVKRGRRPADFGRLDLEQLACERLDHPGLAAYFGATRTPELGTVLAFERLGENPLTLLNAPGARPRFRDPFTTFFPLPPGRAIELAFDVLLALEHVHAREFVHGGVTLANVRVRTATRATHPADVLRAVADGGFEGVLAGLGGARSLAFLDGLRKGSDPELGPLPDPVHAPPEALVELEELDGKLHFARAMDVYSFGLVFYTLLTGRSPYDHICKPSELKHPKVVREVKEREAKGQLSPVVLEALDTIPFHDSPFAGAVTILWPRFRAAVGHVIRECTRRSPSERPEVHAVRQLFEDELRLRPSGTSGARPWTQHLFQMLQGANRLGGDPPAHGISIREEGEDNVVVEERLPVVEAEPATAIPVPDGSIVAFRDADHLGKTDARKRVGLAKARSPGTLSLRSLLEEFRKTKKISESGPFLVTTISLTPREIARCTVYSLARASARLRMGEYGVHEEVRVSIGRAEDNDVVIPDSSVSKRHATLELVGGWWYLEDHGSTNGTELQGKPLPKRVRAKLRGNLVPIKLGHSTELAFMTDGEILGYLEKVLAVVASSFAGKLNLPAPAVEPIVGAGLPTPPPRAAGASSADLAFVDEVPEDPFAFDAKRLPRDAPTRQLPRDLVKRLKTGQPDFPLVRHDAPVPAPAPDPLDGLAARIQTLMVPGAKIRVLCSDLTLEIFDAVADASAFARKRGAEIEQIEVAHPSGSTFSVPVKLGKAR